MIDHICNMGILETSALSGGDSLYSIFSNSDDC